MEILQQIEACKVVFYVVIYFLRDFTFCIEFCDDVIPCNFFKELVINKYDR